MGISSKTHEDTRPGLPGQPVKPREAGGTASTLVAQVAVARPMMPPLSYRVPVDIATSLRPGMRVRVPLRQHSIIGVVSSIEGVPPATDLKAIDEVVDEVPIVPEKVLSLAKWIADYYLCSLGEAINPALPPVSCGIGHTVARLCPLDWEQLKSAGKITKRQQSILAQLSTTKAIALDTLKKRLGTAIRSRELSELVSHGLVQLERSESQVAIPRHAIVQVSDNVIRDSLSGEERGLVGRVFGESTAMSWARISRKLIKDRAAREQFEELLRTERLLWHPCGAEDITVNSKAEPCLEQFSPEQTHALQLLRPLLDQGGFCTALLWGATGSGKTAVLVELARRVLARGQRVLYLVPEIALAESTIGRLSASLRMRVAIWHSARSESQRYWTHRKILSGQYPIVIGARSAVFAPLSNIGLIIVDEEHAESYKQSDPAPRYHGRDAAIVRAREEGALCVLATATPSVETYFNARQGKTMEVRMKSRPAGRTRPIVHVVDLALDRRFRKNPRKKPSIMGEAALGHAVITDQALAEIAEEKVQENNKRDPTHAGANIFLTPELRSALETALSAGRQSILLLNRRGHSTMVVCTACGHTARCPDCDVTLTFHVDQRMMRCHLCTFREKAPDNCPNCGHAGFYFRGIGTQKLVAALRERYPASTIDRLDSDNVRKAGEVNRILSAFAQGRIQILVGTQMVAKGLDFPQVGLVGVVWADRQMAFPDFRAEERTFQLLMQVAGRSGRGESVGEVVVQSFCPEHALIEWVATGLEDDFYGSELSRRQRLQYPPYSRLLRVLVDGNDEARVVDTIRAIAKRLKAQFTLDGDTVLGPASSPLKRVARRHRYHLLIKTTNIRRIVAFLRSALSEKTGHIPKTGVRTFIDVDPIDFM